MRSILLPFRVSLQGEPFRVSSRSEPFPLLLPIPLPILCLRRLKVLVEVPFNRTLGRSSIRPLQGIAKKSPAWRRRSSARKPRHEFRKLLLRYRRRQPFQANSPRRCRQAPWHVTPGPMPVSLPILFPGKEQPFVLKLQEDLFEPLQ